VHFLVALLQATGDNVRHAVTVRVYAYPETAVAVWVMIAVRFMAIEQPADLAGSLADRMSLGLSF
jgi:hypothetical protein